MLSRSFGIQYKRITKENDLNDLFLNIDYEHAINLIEIMIDKDSFPTYSSRR